MGRTKKVNKTEEENKQKIVLCKMFTGNYWENENNLGHETINMFLPDNSTGESYIYLPADGDYKLKKHQNLSWVLLTQTHSGNQKTGELCVKIIGGAKIKERLLEQDFNKACKELNLEEGQEYTCIGGGNNFIVMDYLYRTFGCQDLQQDDIKKEHIEELDSIFKYTKEEDAPQLIKSIKKKELGKVQKDLLQLYNRSKVLAKIHELQEGRIIQYDGKDLKDIFHKNKFNGKINILTTFKVEGLKLLEEDVYLTNQESWAEKLHGNVYYIKANNLSSSSQGTFLENDVEIENINTKDKFREVEKFIEEVLSGAKPAKRLNVDEFEKYEDPSILTITKKEYDELSYSNLFAHFFSIDSNFVRHFFECIKSEDGEDFKSVNIGDSVSSSMLIDNNVWKNITASLSLDPVQREKKNIDIIIEGKEDVIVIENKIKSSLNGKPEKDINGVFVKNQLKKYYKYIEEQYPKHNKHYFIFAPNYNPIEKENMGEVDKVKMKDIWKVIRYSEIFNAFEGYKGFTGHDQIVYEELLKALKVHTAENFKNYYREMQIRMRRIYGK